MLRLCRLQQYESYGYPSSNHPGGVNVAFCGGQVEFMAETIDPLIYGQLMTSNSKRSKLVMRTASPIASCRSRRTTSTD